MQWDRDPNDFIMTMLGFTDDEDKGDNDSTHDDDDRDDDDANGDDSDDNDDDYDDDGDDDDDDDLQWTEIGPSWPNCSLVLCTLKG